jgi:hypothetical protein
VRDGEKHIGVEKDALTRAVFLNRLGEIRDRSFEDQHYRARDLNLVVAAIVLWNTVYPERAVQALRHSGMDIDDKLLPHLSSLGWEHINLTADYISGGRASTSNRPSFDRYGCSPRLSVRFFPFREAPPIRPAAPRFVKGKWLFPYFDIFPP